MPFSLCDPDECQRETASWAALTPTTLAPCGPYHRCHIRRGGKPWRVVDAPSSAGTGLPCTDAVIFGPYLVCGFCEALLFHHLQEGVSRELALDCYFCRLFPHGDRLYATSGTSLYCFGAACSLLWTARGLACDGVLITEIQGDVIRLSCEQDPPGGWVDRQVSTDGRVL